VDPTINEKLKGLSKSILVTTHCSCSYVPESQNHDTDIGILIHDIHVLPIEGISLIRPNMISTQSVEQMDLASPTLEITQNAAAATLSNYKDANSIAAMTMYQRPLHTQLYVRHTAAAPTASIPLTAAMPQSRSVLVQGAIRSAESPLFLATAGIGLIAPYINLPMLPGGRQIYALESPFIDCPEHHCERVERMATMLISAIRRIRPRGPYVLGGYSAGGIYAYEIARQLAAQGESISGLLIADMYVPQAVPAAHNINVQQIESAPGGKNDMFLDNLTASNRQHMSATCRALTHYDPQPMPAVCAPTRTHIMWATEGLHGLGSSKTRAAMGPIGWGRPSQDLSLAEFLTEVKSWFTGERQDFGTNGWEAYLGGEDRVVVHIVPGSSKYAVSNLIGSVS
jgi:hypothetical protein